MGTEALCEACKSLSEWRPASSKAAGDTRGSGGVREDRTDIQTQLSQKGEGRQGRDTIDLLRTVPRGRCSSLKKEPRAPPVGEGWSPGSGWSTGALLSRQRDIRVCLPPALAAADMVGKDPRPF